MGQTAGFAAGSWIVRQAASMSFFLVQGVSSIFLYASNCKLWTLKKVPATVQRGTQRYVRVWVPTALVVTL